MHPSVIGRQNPSPGVHLPSPIQIRSSCVLLTVTTENREPWLANHTAHQHLEQTWREATAWLVTDYVLMPDHLHCFCFPGTPVTSIEKWISYWKSTFRKKHQNPRWRFQSRGWHHRLRTDESYSQKWNYLQQNPVRKNLVQSPDQWPFRGRIHQIPFSF